MATTDQASTAQNAPNGPSSIDPDEVAKFSAIAEEWWDPFGKFKPLHKFNPVRLAYIRDQICDHFARDPQSRAPLEGLRLLDIGCGGGLVAEPMHRLGADVTAIDASDRNIGVARTHAQAGGLEINYRQITAEELLAEGTPLFDVVLNLEVVEHVADVNSFLANAGALIKPGGIMVMATLNRTLKSFALAKVGAEYVLRWLPRGTHDYQKFVTPAEATNALTSAGLSVSAQSGVSYIPLLDMWRLSDDMQVNYMLVAKKAPE